MKHAEHIRVALPSPKHKSSISVEQAFLKRRSVRHFEKGNLSLQQAAQLLWAAQGVTSATERTVPSAGAIHPLEIYLVSATIEKLPAGIYHYQPQQHELIQVVRGDKRMGIAASSLMQNAVIKAAAIIVIAAAYNRTIEKYGDRGKRYVYMEAGHAAQNVCLQAVSINVGTVAMGAFNDSMLHRFLHLPEYVKPLYIMPVGLLEAPKTGEEGG